MHATDYDCGWSRWSDMIKYSPAPFHRRRLIIRLASMQAYRSVLDAGCGNGELLQTLRRANDNVRSVGLDISEEVVKANRTELPMFEFHAMDIGKTHLEDSFDLVVCSEVIEHIDDHLAALRHLRRMCSGRLILTVPTGKVFEIDRLMGHVRHFTASDIRLALEQTGFEVETLWQWGFPFHPIYKRVINAFPDSAMKHFAGRKYSRWERLIGRLTTWLFYLNMKNFFVSNQLIISARVREPVQSASRRELTTKGAD